MTPHDPNHGPAGITPAQIEAAITAALRAVFSRTQAGAA